MSATVPTVYVLAGPNGAGKTSIYWYEAADVPRLNGDALYQQGIDALTIGRRCASSRKNGWRSAYHSLSSGITACFSRCDKPATG